MIEYEIDYRELDAAVFIRFVNEIWPGDYDEMKTRSALSKTMNITAWDGEKLVGCLRVLSDGYYFGTITEMYQGRGIGSRLLKLAGENTPTMLYFGAQPGLETFYEKNGCSRSLTSYALNEK